MIETKRLRLYTASQEAMEQMIAGERDEELKAAYMEMRSGALRNPADREWYAMWMIELKDGAHVGDLSFKGIAGDGMVEIGYGIEEKYWNRGYATEAVSAMVDWASRQPRVTRIEAETQPDNIASQRVLAKCGFVPLGINGAEGPRFICKKPRT